MNLHNSTLLTCAHSDILQELVRIYTRNKQFSTVFGNNFAEIASETLEFLKNRCSNTELHPTYQLLLLPIVEVAFNVVVDINVTPIAPEDLANMLDIDPEAFGELEIDADFDKIMDSNE